MRFTLFFLNTPLPPIPPFTCSMHPWQMSLGRANTEMWVKVRDMKNEGACDLKTRNDVNQFTSVCDDTCRGAWNWRWGALSAGLHISIGHVGAPCVSSYQARPLYLGVRPESAEWWLCLSHAEAVLKYCGVILFGWALISLSSRSQRSPSKIPFIKSKFPSITN